MLDDDTLARKISTHLTRQPEVPAHVASQLSRARARALMRAGAPRRVWARLAKGKSEQEVLKIEGKPTFVDDKSAERHVWTYTSRTFDVNNQNKMDAKTIVIFSPSAEGKMVVAQVLFE